MYTVRYSLHDERILLCILDFLVSFIPCNGFFSTLFIVHMSKTSIQTLLCDKSWQRVIELFHSYSLQVDAQLQAAEFADKGLLNVSTFNLLPLKMHKNYKKTPNLISQKCE